MARRTALPRQLRRSASGPLICSTDGSLNLGRMKASAGAFRIADEAVRRIP
jgi:hypothetical protein